RNDMGMGTATRADIAIVFRGYLFFIFRLWELHAARNDDLHGHFFVDGGHVVISITVVENANHGFLLALHHANDLAFSPAVVADAAHFHQHLVTVHGVADFRRRDKDIALQFALGAGGQGTGLGDDEAVAVAMHAKAADYQILIGGGGRQTPALFADGD